MQEMLSFVDCYQETRDKRQETRNFKIKRSLKSLNLYFFWIKPFLSKTFFLLSLVSCVLSQGYCQIPTNSWQTHFDYSSAKGLEIVQNKVYCFSDNGFFFYDKATNTATKLSKIDGLNDSKIAQIRYDKINNLLLIAYQNGNLDLLKLTKDGAIDKITNINFIQKTSAISGSRSVNQIEFQGNFAYLVCDFGLVELDILKPEIKETYQNIGKNAGSP